MENTNVYITRHAFSCNNLKGKKEGRIGNVLNRTLEHEPSLTTWGVLQTLARSSNYIYTNPQNRDSIIVFVSCLVRTWFTAILLYGPNYKNITLRISPYIKEYDWWQAAGNMPIPFRQQVQKLEHFLNYLKVIRTLADEVKDFASEPLIQIRKIDNLKITILFSEKDNSTKFTFDFDLSNQRYSPINLGYNILSNMEYNMPTRPGFFESRIRDTSTVVELATQSWSPTLDLQKQKEYKPELFRTMKNQPSPGFSYNLDLLKLHNVMKTLDIINRQNPNKEKDVALVKSKPLILLKVISQNGESGNQVIKVEDDSSLNKKDSIPNHEEFKESHIDKFLRWLYQNYPNETEYHCVAHNNIMTSFIDEYFGSSTPAKKKFHLDEQNTWTLTLGMNRRTNVLDESAKINYGKCQPVKNINGITSACEELCDFGFGTVDKPKQRRDECYSKLYNDFTPVQESCTTESSLIVTPEIQAGNKRSRKNRSKAKRRTRHVLRRR
jgi:hypothetical protein